MNSNQKMIGVLVIALALAIGAGVAWPLYGQYGEIAEIRDARAIILSERSNAIEAVDRLSEELRNRQVDLDRIAIIVPPIKSQPEIINSIESTALLSGISLLSLNISEPKQSSGMGEIRQNAIKIVVSGSYVQLVDFLGKIEQNLRLTDIDTISLSQDPSSSLLNLTISAKNYFLKSRPHT